jgi:hypothetical protein
VHVLEQGISNGRVERRISQVRHIIRRAYGLHSAESALALGTLAWGRSISSYLTNGPSHRWRTDPQESRESSKRPTESSSPNPALTVTIEAPK